MLALSLCSCAGSGPSGASRSWDGTPGDREKLKLVALAIGLPNGARPGAHGELDSATCGFICGPIQYADIVSCGLEPMASSEAVGCHHGGNDRHAFVPVSSSFRPRFDENVSLCSDVCKAAGEKRGACGLVDAIPTRFGELVTCHYK